MRLRPSRRGARRQVTDRQRAKWWDAFTAAWSAIAIVMHESDLAARRSHRPWCANCLEHGPALRPRQLADGGPLFLLCAACDEQDARTIANDPVRFPVAVSRGPARSWQRKNYVPIDEVDRDPSTRILRVVQRFDWIGSADIFDLLGVPSIAIDRVAHNNFSVRLSYLSRHGFLRRRHVMECGEYQITNLGRARIEHWARVSVENKRSIAA